MAKKLSVAAIEKLKADPAKRREVPDAGKPGLYLVVQPSGRKSWAVRYRLRGRTGKLTLSGFPALPVARKLAQDALDDVAAGKDPAERKRRERTISDLVEDVFAEFLAKHVAKRNGQPVRISHRKETGRLLGLRPVKDANGREDLTRWEPTKSKLAVLHHWKGRDVKTITKRDVLDVLDKTIARGSPVGANRRLAALKTFFGWTVKRDIRETSPCDHLDRPSPENKVERALSDAEIGAAWRAADGMGFAYGRMVQMLILVGQRRDEVRAAARSEIADNVLQIDGSRTKNHRTHLVPLGTAAQAILVSLPKIKGERGFLFTLEGEVPVSNLSRCKHKLDKAMRAELGDDFRPWRLHDLRHTLKTWMQEKRIPKDVRSAVQNHIDGDMDSHYGHYSFLKEKREALEAWGQHVLAVVARTADRVVAFQEAAE